MVDDEEIVKDGDESSSDGIVGESGNRKVEKEGDGRGGG